MRKVLILIITLMILPAALAADPGHPAEGVSPGTFEAGDFYFNGSSIVYPSNIQEISTIAVPPGAKASKGRILFTGSNVPDSVLSAIDYSDPYNPVIIGNLSIDGAEIKDIEIVGQYAYLANDDNTSRALTIVDISDATNMVEVSNLTLPDDAYTVQIYGQYAIMGLRNAGDEFAVIDVSDATNPTQVASLPLDAQGFDITIEGHYAYVGMPTNGGGELAVINITDPTNPTQVVSKNMFNSLPEVEASNGMLYATLNTGSNGEVYSINITDPSNPTVIDNFVLPGFASTLSVYGEYLFVGAGSLLYIIDAANPASLQQVIKYNHSIALDSAIAHDGKLVLSADATNLTMFDIGQLRSPFGKIGSLISDEAKIQRIETNTLRAASDIQAGDGGFFTTGPITTTQNISAPAICLDGDCRTVWPSGGSGLWTNSSGDATYTAGNVGIGTTNPISTLEIADTETTFNSSPRAVYVNYTINPSDDDGEIYSGLYSDIRIDGANTNEVGNLYGVYGIASGAGSGSMNAITGMYGYSTTSSTAGILSGVVGAAAPALSSIDSAYALDGLVSPIGATITNAFGARLQIRDLGGSTITNGYGLLIGQIDATNEYGIYQNDSEAINYFAGNLLLNTTTDSGYALQVDGTVNATAFIGDGSGLTNVAGGIWTNESGTATFDGDANVSGTIYYGGNLTGYGADFAERMTMSEPVEKTDVVCLQEDGSIKKCRKDADPAVAGVVSTQATIIGNAGAPNSIPVGIVGIVPTKVAGPVEQFSLLTTSTQAGVAQEASIDDFGAIIGKAMEGCDQEICTVDVLVGLR